MKSALIAIFIGIVVYEIIEHLILPLFWMIRYGRRKSSVDPSGMIGKNCLVKKWEGNSGKVQVASELWNATGQSDLIPGDQVVVKDIEGLTLKVSVSEKSNDQLKEKES